MKERRSESSRTGTHSCRLAFRSGTGQHRRRRPGSCLDGNVLPASEKKKKKKIKVLGLVRGGVCGLGPAACVGLAGRGTGRTSGTRHGTDGARFEERIEKQTWAVCGF